MCGVGPGLEVFLKYRLRFTDGLDGQLLIGHRFCSNKIDANQRKSRSSRFLDFPHHILFRSGLERTEIASLILILFCYLAPLYVR